MKIVFKTKKNFIMSKSPKKFRVNLIGRRLIVYPHVEYASNYRL